MIMIRKAYIHQHYSMAHNIELKNHSHTNARVQSWLSMSSTTYLKRIIIFQTLRNKRKIFFKKKKGGKKFSYLKMWRKEIAAYL